MSILRHSLKKKLAAAAITASLGLSLSAYADTGGLRIVITDSSGQPISGATINASSLDSLSSKQVTTNSDGYARLIGLDPARNYEIIVNGETYKTLTKNNVRVMGGQSLSLSYTLAAANSDERITIIGGKLSTLDTTSAVVSTDITLDMTDSLPTARNYQAYLQLAPGTKPSIDGNPSSKSGVNYADAVDANGNTAGSSTDNVYYIDGVNVTDNLNGTAGASFNSEIIQEQQVITGGIPAEYAGGQGLVSRVVTKSGSDEFHGSINYYFQNDSLVADNENIPDAGFDSFDTAVTLGGPLIEDQLWFYASYQLKNTETDIVNTETGDLSRTVEDERKLGFGKITWQMTDSDRFQATFFNDPSTISGSTDFRVLGNRDRAQVQGGDNYKFEYSHSWLDFILTANYFQHEGEVSSVAADVSTRDDIAFYASNNNPVTSDTDVGGRGSNTVTFRNNDEIKFTLEYFLETDFGEHAFKFGYSQLTNDYKRNLLYTGDGSQYNSISSGDAGVTWDDYVNGSGWSGDLQFSTDDAPRIIDAMASSSNSAAYLAQYDTNADGEISATELNALVFNTTAGNPYGNVNAYRIAQTQAGATDFQSKGKTLFLQDTWTYNQLTINAGLRAEQWEHYATDGSKIFTFDWDIAPRLSAVYDINGDGSSKVWAFIGRYYDPIRNDMTSFAGTLTGSVREEQIYTGTEWLTFRTRGGAQTVDGYFAPTTKTPYTDEFMIGYSKSLTDDMSIEVTYTDRKTRDIMEDYDLATYANAGDYTLPLSYFGFTEAPDSNYVIATLEGGKRDYSGLEFTFRKHKSDNWQALASYTYNDAQGNSNSDGNADLQGDLLYLDPRAPNLYGEQPGNIEHLFKVAGSYSWDNGFEVGAIYNWNSGLIYSTTYSIYGREIALRVDDAYEDGGVTTRWLDSGVQGANSAGSYGTLDLRVKYATELSGYNVEVFLDIFNALDDQAGIRSQALATGGDGFAFGESNNWVKPRRFYLGARLSF